MLSMVFSQSVYLFVLIILPSSFLVIKETAYLDAQVEHMATLSANYVSAIVQTLVSFIRIALLGLICA